MTREQRAALKNLATWNKDPKCPRMFRIQDKGSHILIGWKSNYRKEMLKYLEDISIFKEESEDPGIRNLQRVQKWAEKWHREERISEEQMEWITLGNPKVSRVHANIFFSSLQD